MEVISGKPSEINKRIVISACNNKNSLIIDSARACNPYSIIDKIDVDKLHEVYVMSAESIYRFRSAIKLLPLWIRKYNIRNIYVTSLSGFYSYENTNEDYSILEESYNLLLLLEKKLYVNVFIAVPDEERFNLIINNVLSH